MHTLHVVEPGSPDAGPSVLRLAAEAAGADDGTHDVIVLGGAADGRMAEACGLAGAALVPARWPAGRGAIRRVVRARRQPDRARAWSIRSALSIAAALPRRSITLCTAEPPRGQLETVALRRLIGRLIVIVGHEARLEAWLTFGVPRADLHVEPPVVPRIETSPLDRRRCRARWKAQQDDFMIGLIGEPIDRCDVMTATALVYSVGAAGRPFRLLVHPRSPRLFDAVRWLRECGAEHRIGFEPELATPWSIAAGLDAALHLPSRTGASRVSGRPALWMLAAGVPTLVPIGSDIDPLLRDSMPRPREFADAGALLMHWNEERNGHESQPVQRPATVSA